MKDPCIHADKPIPHPLRSIWQVLYTLSLSGRISVITRIFPWLHAPPVSSS